MATRIEEWWDNNARTFQREHKIPLDISYGPGMPNEDQLHLMGSVKGKDILEIGCGAAQCGISLAKRGARVIGIDISREQLRMAHTLSNKNNVQIRLLKGNMCNLHQVKSNSQDIVFSSYALFYVDDLRSCFREAYRVLKKGGLFVFSTHHPFWETLNKKTMKVKRCYFETGRYEKSRLKGTFVGYRYSVSQLATTLAAARFTLQRIEEPDPRAAGGIPSEVISNTHKRRAMRLIPRTIIFKAKKV